MNTKNIIIYSLLLLSLPLFSQRVLNPEEAFSMALDYNYGIKITNNSLEIAENNTSILNSGYLPTVTGNAGATYNLDNTEAQFANGESTVLNGAESSRYNASVNLNYVVFDGMGRQYNYKRLKEEYFLSQLEARETIENVIIQLFTIYYNLAKTSENTLALEQTLNISKDRLLRAEYQFDYGQNTKLGVLNAQVDINNDSINLINIRQQLKNTKRDLNVVIGNQIAEDFNVKTDLKFLLDLDKNELLSKTKANNVALLQADKNISIGEINIKARKSQYLPTVGLIGTYGWNKNNNNAASFATTTLNTGLSGGINLAWDLFDGGSTITQVKNTKINLDNQKLQKEQLIINIERDFYNAWEDYQNKLVIFNVQEDNIITSENNFNRTQEKFKLGQATSIEFRQAQLNLRNAELSRNQAKYDAKLAELTVLQISGDLLNVEF
ncbi:MULTISPECIES: TolC family protein [Bizionia]|uniref:TolC family protein n=1 Tax=Bizionia algoritergicola TaxID=291187 RepID=A0A5D0QUE5_9FLAO|nr:MULTISPECIES: TolC family protein [Bizionia]OBX22758.1 transporter [Bizionia sp. APA-3]TYB72469.1 TolC family protein [Bizionia algoritergicola]